MDRSLRLLVVLCAAALSACDPVYGVLSYSPLISDFDPACVDRTLRGVPGVSNVQLKQSEYSSFEVAPDWGRKTTYNTDWAYTAGGQTIFLQITRDHRQLVYRNHMNRMGPRFSRADLDAAEATIRRVDSAVLAACNLQPKRQLGIMRR